MCRSKSCLLFSVLSSVFFFFFLWYGAFSNIPALKHHVRLINTHYQSRESDISANRYDLHRWLYSPDGQSHLSADNLPEDGLAPLTAWAQQHIWRHQYRLPEDCALASFSMATPYPTAGVGSVLHSATYELAAAIESGRILLWHPTSASSFTTVKLCGSVQSWECFFLPLTNCSAWANASNTLNMVTPPSTNFVPTRFQNKISQAEPTFNEHGIKYWWRAQGAAFIARLNNITITNLWKLRTTTNMAIDIRGNHRPSDIFPLPRGTISSHVRHGDKSIEMPLVPWEVYAKAAEQAAEMQPLALSRNIFLSTEDPAVVREAAFFPGEMWSVFVSDIPRENSNGMAQMALADEVIYFHLGQLLLALEADAWVGTRGSNWNRLIDELRCIWIPKCLNTYIEVGLHEGNYWF